MFRFLPYILKSLWRHRIRTGLTVSGAAVALFVFCFVGSIQEGLDDLTRGDDARRTLIVFQENRFCPTTSRLPEDYAQTIGRIDGVADVVPIQVYSENCRASLNVVVFHGLPPERLRQQDGITLVSGSWDEFESRRDAAVVGRAAARRAGRTLKVGDQYTVGNNSVRIAGLFESSMPNQENVVYTHLEFLQRTGGRDGVGTVTQFEVQLTDSADPQWVASTIDELLRTRSVATTTRPKGVFQTSTLSDLVDLIRFAYWLGYASLGLVLSIVGATTVMAVQDRAREHALLKTLGFRPGRIFRLVLGETLLLCLAGGALGTASALAVLAVVRPSVGAEGVSIAFQPSVSLALTGLVMSTLVGLVAGAAPAIGAARGRIVEALNQ